MKFFCEATKYLPFFKGKMLLLLEAVLQLLYRLVKKITNVDRTLRYNLEGTFLKVASIDVDIALVQCCDKCTCGETPYYVSADNTHVIYCKNCETSVVFTHNSIYAACNKWNVFIRGKKNKI